MSGGCERCGDDPEGPLQGQGGICHSCYNEQERKHDPDVNRLMAKIMDDIDARLFKHGLQFRGDDLYPATEELRALIYKYYEDITGGDSSYDPNADKSTEIDSDQEESVSRSLHSSDDEPSMSDRSTSESGEVRETKKQKK